MINNSKNFGINLREKKKDYLVYLLWLFGVIPSNILKNYIVVKNPTLKAPKVLYLIEWVSSTTNLGD